MHRILAENAESRERRNQLRHPVYKAPQLLVSKPNELWCWDITKLLGPQKWTYYYLYVVLDVYSRYVVGWLLANRECGEFARRLMAECFERQDIAPEQLTVHSDRGSPMKSKTLGQLYADLGVTKTHSRPHQSNDNPFSESQFKTLKYRPGFPARFGSQEHARDCVRDLLDWYNHEHHHSRIEWLTPFEVHHGLGESRLEERAAVLTEAYLAHPERFVHGPPKAAHLPSQVWINPPRPSRDDEAKAETISMEEAGPEGPTPSVLPPTRRSGCSSAEPYPPSRHVEPTAGDVTCNPLDMSGGEEVGPHPDCLQSDKPRGLGQSPSFEDSAPLAAHH
jgi:putative transposase